MQARHHVFGCCETDESVCYALFRGRSQVHCEADKPTSSLMWSKYRNAERKATVKDCPLVWDTGALFGLTTFCGDFVDYVMCKITVQDIACENTVVSIGTTLHRFKIDGEDFFLPCLSYHLPSAEVHLFSPQTYHTLYDGHITVWGNEVDMFIDHLKVSVDIDQDGSNVPMINDCSVSAEQMREYRPHI